MSGSLLETALPFDTSSEGAAGCAVAAALFGRAHGKIVAIVSGGNIDSSAFASLVGASRER